MIPVRTLGFVLLFVVGLIATIRDRAPAVELPRRAGWIVLACDFHAHTRFSDGLLSPFDLVLNGERVGLDAFAVTEHNQVFPAKMARWYSQTFGGPTIVIGEEITTRDFHLIALGLEARVPAMNAVAAVEAVHAQGGLVLAAHPTKPFWNGLEPIRDVVDGVEIMHPIALRPPRPGWSIEDIVHFHGTLLREKAPIVVGSSDFHGGPIMGVIRTWVFVERNDERAILDALRARRTVVESPDGRKFGDPALIAELAQSPLATRGPRPPTSIDYLLRVLGFVAACFAFAGRGQKAMTQTS